MPQFTIYSIGDSAYLARILNGIAAISGAGDMERAASIGLLLGVVAVIVSAILRGSMTISFQQLLISVVMYFALFGASARVTIEDSYDGTIRVVNNVPFGIGAVGSVVSNVGYFLTTEFEQAFSTPPMTEYGFAGTLSVLMDVWRLAQSRISMAPANAPVAGMNVEESFTNYIKECTFVGVDLGQKTIPETLANNDPMDAIRWDSAIYTTAIYPAGGEQILTCTQAWARLNHDASAIMAPALAKLIAKRLQIPVGDAWPTIQTAVDQLGVAGATAAQVVGAMLIGRRLEEGTVAKHEDDMAWSRAAMMQQAFMQRDAQWAAQESMFASIVRPMMTFFEGLVYAITPLMAFVIVLGPFGITLVVKYLQMLLWIQLWMPILAIINLFINMTVAGKMQVFSGAGGVADLSSVNGVFHLADILQHWLGVGGMLASATPAISLMLIYGGAVAATHLAGRLQGGDHINEKIAAPDTMKPGPLLDMGARFTDTPPEGTTGAGASGVLPTFDTSRVGSWLTKSSESEARSASTAFSMGVGRAVTESAREQYGSVFEQAKRHDWSSSSDTADRALHSLGDQISSSYDHTKNRSSDFSGAAAAAVTGALSAGGGLIKGAGGGMIWDTDTEARMGAKFDATLRDQMGIKDADTRKDMTGDFLKWASDKTTTAALKNGLTFNDGTSHSNVFTSGLDESTKADLGQKQSVAQQKQSNYEQAASFTSSDGVRGSFKTPALANNIAGNDGLFDRMTSALRSSGYYAAAQQQQQALMTPDSNGNALFTNPRQAMAAAGMMVLGGYTNTPGTAGAAFEQKLAARQSARSIAAEAMGMGTGTGIPSGQSSDPYNNAGVAGDIDNQLDRKVAAAGLPNAGTLMAAGANVPLRVAAENNRATSATQGRAEQLVGHHATALGGVQHAAQTYSGGVGAESLSFLRDSVMGQHTDTSDPGEAVMRTGSKITKSIGELTTGLNTVLGGITGAKNAYDSAYEKAVANGASIPEAVSAGWDAAGIGMSDGIGHILGKYESEATAEAAGREVSPAVAQLYGAASLVPGVAEGIIPGEWVSPNIDQAREAVRRDYAYDPELGEKVIAITEHSAAAGRPEMLDTVAAYEQVRDE